MAAGRSPALSPREKRVRGDSRGARPAGGWARGTRGAPLGSAAGLETRVPEAAATGAGGGREEEQGGNGSA